MSRQGWTVEWKNIGPCMPRLYVGRDQTGYTHFFFRLCLGRLHVRVWF